MLLKCVNGAAIDTSSAIGPILRIVVKFELFELYYWLEHYELY